MDTILDWAEKAGSENMKFRLQNAETLAKDSATTLTILLAGLAGSLTYLLKYIEPATASLPLAAGAGALSAWFMGLSAMLVHNCIRTLPLPPPTNEPMNLFQPNFSIEALREAELRNLQIRIDQIGERNANVATWLDRVRYGTLSGPIIFLIVAAVFWAHGLVLFALARVAG